MTASRHLWYASLEFLCCAAGLAIWFWIGVEAFLFVAGLAFGCGFVISALGFERWLSDREERRERIDAGSHTATVRWRT